MTDYDRDQFLRRITEEEDTSRLKDSRVLKNTMRVWRDGMLFAAPTSLGGHCQRLERLPLYLCCSTGLSAVFAFMMLLASSLNNHPP